MVNARKSCLTCPSYMEVAETAQFFGKATGVPMCARFGRPMGTMKSKPAEREAIAQEFAKICSHHGEPRPGSPNWDKISLTVTMADPEAMAADSNIIQPENVQSCGVCRHFVREDIVANDLGFATGACARHGKLLPADRMTRIARACEEKSFAISGVRTSTSGMMFLPVYADNFLGDADPVRRWRRYMRNFVDPTEYVTDRDVTPEEHEAGIRAWRYIQDELSGKSVEYPIYRRDFFSPEEQDKIPATGDDEHPEDYIDHQSLVYKCVVAWTKLDETPILWGPAGVGKTELGRHIAWLFQIPFERFSITGSSDVDDLSGKMMFGPMRDPDSGEVLLTDEGKVMQGTYPQYGRVTKAWGKPCVLDLDEPNAGPSEVWQYLRPMTDNSKQLVLDWYDGRNVDRHPDCYPLLTANPAHDLLNIGVHDIAEADADRLWHVDVHIPPAELEREIIRTRCSHDDYELPTETLDRIMNIAVDIREASETLNITWGIRQQIKVARATPYFDMISCYRLAVADRLEPKVSESFLDIVRRFVDG